MLRHFFQKHPLEATSTNRPSPWRDLVMAILAVGVVIVAVADKDYRQPFYLIAGSAITSHFVVKKSDTKQ